jgi:aspartokinase-like uncharacterized kinase
MNVSPTVVKVGGSLLDWPELPRRLAEDLARRQGPFVLIAGGGPAVDFVRTLDRIHGLGEERSHWLALRALDFTAYVLAGMVPDARVIVGLAEANSAGRTVVLAPRCLLETDEMVPHSWHATSDSIAAVVAARLGARELVLLKSAPVPPGLNCGDAARLGRVDPLFPELAHGLSRVVYRNLREPEVADTRLQ